jgi:hypothetical protein
MGFLSSLSILRQADINPAAALQQFVACSMLSTGQRLKHHRFSLDLFIGWKNAQRRSILMRFAIFSLPACEALTRQNSP